MINQTWNPCLSTQMHCRRAMFNLGIDDGVEICSAKCLESDMLLRFKSIQTDHSLHFGYTCEIIAGGECIIVDLIVLKCRAPILLEYVQSHALSIIVRESSKAWRLVCEYLYTCNLSFMEQSVNSAAFDEIDLFQDILSIAVCISIHLKFSFKLDHTFMLFLHSFLLLLLLEMPPSLFC